jgi:topoisomerase-4 subunit A
VIEDNKPLFIGVSDMLKYQQTERFSYLRVNLKFNWVNSKSNGISCLWNVFLSKQDLPWYWGKKQQEDVIQAVDDGLKPHVKHLKRAVTEEDILRLLDIRIMHF